MIMLKRFLGSKKPEKAVAAPCVAPPSTDLLNPLNPMNWDSSSSDSCSSYSDSSSSYSSCDSSSSSSCD